ncbi:hypothetical protein WN944_020001 [Citrus x changshan-huyou]|uniref:Uncharacterized protein n=1 Tax=Citrus x changshan-huyou TaxID=2935761 RepID=A0AAP0LXC9_9ROSI
MGRGRVQLKRIENKINRQVTFSKRRAGFLKKAHEISVLCDAEVAVIIFSHKGKLFEYSTGSCMEKILERYERYAYAERQLIAPDPESQAKIDLLQKNQRCSSKSTFYTGSQIDHFRHYLGEDLESLSLKDIQQLEQQLDTALKHIRSRKNQLMQESISELQKKEKSIEEQNNLLVKQIKEREKAAAQQAQWGNQIQNQVPNTLSFLLPQPPPCLRLGGAYQEQASEMRRNELNLTLEPVCSCSLGCFAG